MLEEWNKCLWNIYRKFKFIFYLNLRIKWKKSKLHFLFFIFLNRETNFAF